MLNAIVVVQFSRDSPFRPLFRTFSKGKTFLTNAKFPASIVRNALYVMRVLWITFLSSLARPARNFWVERHVEGFTFPWRVLSSTTKPVISLSNFSPLFYSPLPKFPDLCKLRKDEVTQIESCPCCKRAEFIDR